MDINVIAGLMDGVGSEMNLIPYTVKTFHVHDSIRDLHKLYHSYQPQFLHVRKGNDNSNYLMVL